MTRHHKLERPKLARTGIGAKLAARAETGTPIRVGVVGCGEMGTDLVTQIGLMTGIEIGGIVTRKPERARRALQIAFGSTDKGREVSDADGVNAAIEAGKMAVVARAEDLLAAGRIDVIVDATGNPAAGAEIGLKTIQAGKPLVMMNVEADVTIGPYLRREADRAGVIYTIGAGDEPSSVLELYDFVTAMGHPVVAAGKGKNNPLNFDATPDQYEEEAHRRDMNPRMLVEFVDGSKTMVEMAAIANATGLVPDVPGMHGPDASIENLHQVLCPREDGGILHRKGVVDYTIGGGIAPGVFVVAEMAHPRIRERMADLKLGPGPYYAFFRPYHLTSLEVPLSCARVVLTGQADMVPLDRPTAEVCALAKKDLKAGDRLDAIGEYCYRSFTMTVEDARAENACPVGLLQGAIVRAPIKKGALVSYGAVSLPEDTPLVKMRRAQDAWLASG
ncbi:MAG: homoserine dehydrogenase [Alphaproteobacteria bacterium]|nr:homoserine dehydrogenase [Alphaproteobacteria bacterium]